MTQRNDQDIVDPGFRDVCAALAMVALIASRHDTLEDGFYDENVVAVSAYDMADAMLAARERT